MPRCTALLLATALLSVLAACAPRYPSCSGDSHCRGGERCLQGRCQRRAAAPPVRVSARGQALALQRACDGGSAASCYLLAQQHRSGRGVPKDSERADALLQRACNGDHAGACAALGRPAPYAVTLKGSVPGLRIPGYSTIYVGPIQGPQGPALRAALKSALQESCRCFVVISNDIELLNQGELALVGRVLRAEQVPRGPTPSSAPAAPGPPIRCAQVSLSAKLWLFDGADPRRTREVLLHGRAVAEERCTRALAAATASLAGELAARLDRSYTYRGTLFKAPALQVGNELIVAAKWEAALAHYDKALSASGALSEAKEPRAHAHYARSLALAELGRYPEALTALQQAQQIRPDPRYVRALRQLQLAAGPAYALGPPAQPKRARSTPKAGKKKKVIQGIRRTVIYR